MTHTPLDSFESALLAELRTHVAEQPARQAEPRGTRGRRVRRFAVGAVAAGLAASVVGVVSLGGHGGASPAYAVELDGDGDVVVTVHRLDDAAGLEKALRAKGVDADVSYDADGNQGPTTVGIGPDGEPMIGEELQPPPEGAITEEHGSLVQRDTATGGADEQGVVRDAEGLPPGDDPCGFDAAGRAQPGRLRLGAPDPGRVPAAGPARHDRHRRGRRPATCSTPATSPARSAGSPRCRRRPRPAS